MVCVLMFFLVAAMFVLSMSNHFLTNVPCLAGWVFHLSDRNQGAKSNANPNDPLLN